MGVANVLDWLGDTETITWDPIFSFFLTLSKKEEEDAYSPPKQQIIALGSVNVEREKMISMK